MSYTLFRSAISNLFVRRNRRNRRRPTRRMLPKLEVETLENREVPSTGTLDYLLYSPGGTPDWSSSPSGGLTPDQIRTAYGISSVSVNGVQGFGSGQTIAIIDPYSDPNIVSDLATFDSTYGTSSNELNSRSASSILTVVNQNGAPSPLPANNVDASVEESLDVEWAHSVAPGANILLVECNSLNGISDVLTAVNTAATTPGVSVVSMSFGFNEFSTEANYDSDFTQSGVTFVASAGDDQPGFDGPQWPAVSPNVVSVGGTTLTLNTNNTIQSEVVWNGLTTEQPPGATAGGNSLYESIPAYQDGVSGVVGSNRGVPDVTFDADPATGVEVYDSYYDSSAPWGVVGGTSLSAPCWAGVIAITDQERVGVNLNNLTGYNQTLPYLYEMPESVFNDITSGDTTSTYGTFNAAPGYDLASGRGSPFANRTVLSMVNNPVLFPEAGATVAVDMGYTSGNNLYTVVNTFSVANNGYIYTDQNPNVLGNFTGFSGLVPVDPYAGRFSPGKSLAAVAGSANGSEAVFAVDTNGVIEYDFYNGTSWGSFADVGSANNFVPGEQISVVAGANGTYTLFASTNVGGIETAYYNGSSWGSYGTIIGSGLFVDGGALTAVPSTGTYSMALFATDSYDQILYDQYSSTTSWTGFDYAGTATIFIPGRKVAVVPGSNGAYTIFATSNAGAIETKYYNGSSWTAFTALSGTGTFADGGAVTAVGAYPNGSLAIFAVNESGVLEWDLYNGTSWSGLTAVNSAADFAPGQTVAPVSFIDPPLDNSSFYVFGISNSGEEYGNDHVENSWSGYFAFGGGVIG